MGSTGSTKTRARVVSVAVVVVVLGGGVTAAVLWPARAREGAPPASPAATASTSPPSDVAVLRGARSHGARLAQRPGGGATETEQPMQRQLCEAALAAERAGRTDEAARIYQRLLERTPHGSLAEQARANLAAIERAPR